MIIASYLFFNIETNICGSSSVGLFTPSGPVRMTDFAHEAARYRPSTCDRRTAISRLAENPSASPKTIHRFRLTGE